MSQAAGNLVDASLIWQQLSERIDAFATAWQLGQPPQLGDFLPEGPPALRRMTLVEAVKVDLEYRWQDRRWPKLVEEYVLEFPDLAADGGVPCDLIYEEYHIRKQKGDAVSIGEYCDRFPDRGDQLRRLFKLEAPEQTTVLVSAERAPVFEAGQRIDDFDLLASLGKGAFATVFLARQCSMQRLVALKISRDRGFEPQTLAQLDHPHIVRVFDQRQLGRPRLRLLYMQYVAGGTLQGVVEQARGIPAAARDGSTLLAAIDRALARNSEQPPADSMTRYRLQRLNWPQVVCWLGARLAGALAYAHQRGVLHRDVKPANVLVGADGHPKLADFNISFSKLDGATPAAYFGGSLAYMSPEQLEACDPAHPRQAEELDGRSDIYSLGVLLWELLTLRRPFADDALGQSWSQVLPKMTGLRRAGVAAEALELVPRDCPRQVTEALLKCLEQDPKDRYQGAAELASELDLCLQPRAHALLRPRWGAVFKRHPVFSTIVLGTVPNVFMSILNVAFNWMDIVDSETNNLSAEDKRVFIPAIVGINLLAYAIGLGYVVYSRGRVFLTLHRLARGQPVQPPPSAELVRRCLTLGYVTAVVTAVLWTISGFVFPAVIEYGAGNASRIQFGEYADFIVSNLLCGMIAATQSYYAVTFFAVRYCCPWLLQARPPDSRGVSDLAEQAHRDRIFLGLTFAVPFLALLSVLALSDLQMIPDIDDKLVLGALCALGFIGCAMAYILELTIRADLMALAGAMSSAGDPLSGSGSVPGFITDSR